MALEIEDGTIVEDAVSYVTAEELRAYATARGVTVSEDDEELEPLLIKAMDYLEAQAGLYQGTKVSADQCLQWPRAGVVVDGFDVAEDSIPRNLKQAQCQLALDALTADLMPNTTGREIIKEKLDVLETQYAPSGNGAPPAPRFTKANALLQSLFSAGVLGSLNIIRC